MSGVSHATIRAALDMGGSHVYSWLAPGDTFHFPKHPEVVFVKGKGGWFTDAEGRRFRTGRGTAVVLVKRAV